jgi:LPXTG-motif cell wall-anchored protein
MKKLIMFALLGMLFIGAPTVVFAQGEDSTEVNLDEPKDTISIDNMDPVYYEEEATKESSNSITYAFVGGIVVIGGAAFYFIRKKKK